MSKTVTIDDEKDEVQIKVNGSSYGTSGRVIYLLAQDMFGWTVDQYIRDAQLGARIRLSQKNPDLYERVTHYD